MKNIIINNGKSKVIITEGYNVTISESTITVELVEASKKPNIKTAGKRRRGRPIGSKSKKTLMKK
tara:strand:- start:313 stop:507 length:195 start_codon:yes stop_codon:yes gene_type:complete